MRVIITDEAVEIYRDGLTAKDCPGGSCREFAEWAMATAIERLSREISNSIKHPGSGTSVLCD